MPATPPVPFHIPDCPPGSDSSDKSRPAGLSQNSQPENSPDQPPVFPGASGVLEAPDSPATPFKRRLSQAVAVVWVFLGSQIGLSAALSLFFGLILGFLSALDTGMLSSLLWWFQKNLDVLLTVGAVAGSGLAALLFGASQFKISIMKELTNTRFDKKWLLQGTFMMYTASFFLGLLITLVNSVTSRFGFGIEENALPGPYGFVANVLLFLCVAVIGPVLEECVFRGIICKGLSRYSKGFAVVFSALLFALAHMNFYQAIPAFGMGLVLGFVYLKSGSLLPVVFMHIFNNSLSMLAGYLPEDGFLGLWLPLLLSLLILGMAIAGIVVMVQQKKEIGAMLRQCKAAVLEWRTTMHSVSFWLLPVFFLTYQLIASVIGMIASWILYYAMPF